MATLLKTLYGNTVTAGSNSFRVVAEIYSTQENTSSGHYLQAKYYVQVIDGQSSAFTSYFKVSWNSGNSYSLSTAGNYAVTTVDIGWVGYSNSTSVSIYGYYEGGSGTIYKSSLSDSYTVPAKTANTITVAFNANGGSGAPSSVKGTPGSITIPTTAPTRTGYTFDGYTAQSTRVGSTSPPLVVNKNGTYLKYFRIGRLNPNVLEVLAYAESLSSVKVAFWTVAGGQDDLIWHNLGSGSWSRDGKAYNFGVQVRISDHIKYNTYQDLISYHAHWYGIKSADSTEVALHCPASAYIDVEFFPSESYPFEFGATLYAQWTANQYTLSFSANGGSVSTSSKTVTYNSTYGTLPTPTRTGYTFNGWYTSESGGNRKLSSDTYSTAGNSTLYAHWTGNSYTVQYDGNGSTSGSTANSTHVYGTATALTANGFTRTGYEFIGWNTKADGSGTSYLDQSSVSDLTSTNGGTVTLYAQWDINTYILTLDANGGQVDNSSLPLSHGTSNYHDISWNIPTRSGYIFAGWYTESSGGVQVYDSNGIVVNDGTYWQDNYSIYGTAYTLYAQWEVRPNQDIYIMNNEIVYARAFFVNDETYIDSTGAIYAPNFNIDNHFSVTSNGIIAVGFKEGIPMQ